MFGLTQNSKNAVCVQVFTAMTNGDMVKAIREEISLNREDFISWGTKHHEQVETFLKRLLRDSDGLFVDPCYDEFNELTLYFGFDD